MYYVQVPGAIYEVSYKLNNTNHINNVFKNTTVRVVKTQNENQLDYFVRMNNLLALQRRVGEWENSLNYARKLSRKPAVKGELHVRKLDEAERTALHERLVGKQISHVYL
ncbi:hypothetical protein GCM10007377_16240 [Galliscardovia ingluviei]|uniref:Uncharacterized protein n=1 Tax=Galliscardovia ingluviei TaxID=1769422 RepID=A0A8J3ARW8_9BIFI|nr:hypothetical protein GCM10007377_16240 [Galliscardovia ingluviei]